MTTPAQARFRRVRDYNRALALPVRAAHALAALAATALDELADRWRRGWVVPLALGAAAFALVHPFDQPLADWFTRHPLRGDFRRELEALQQFGQTGFSVVIGLAILLLDPLRRRRLLDWAAAALLAIIASNLLKMALGRPRPLLNDPDTFVGPLGAYPLPRGDSFVLASGWTSGYDLGSCPSRHATMAAVAACFLILTYPRLRLLALALALLVGLARVITSAHWPTDVIAGWSLGTACALPALRGYWGTRFVDLAWRRLIDPHAQPAAPALRTACGD